MNAFRDWVGTGSTPHRSIQGTRPAAPRPVRRRPQPAGQRQPASESKARLPGGRRDLQSCPSGKCGRGPASPVSRFGDCGKRRIDCCLATKAHLSAQPGELHWRLVRQDRQSDTNDLVTDAGESEPTALRGLSNLIASQTWTEPVVARRI